MVRTPAVALLNVCQTSSANVLINFLKLATISPDMSWMTGSRPRVKSNII